MFAGWLFINSRHSPASMMQGSLFGLELQLLMFDSISSTFMIVEVVPESSFGVYILMNANYHALKLLKDGPARETRTYSWDGSAPERAVCCSGPSKHILILRRKKKIIVEVLQQTPQPLTNPAVCTKVVGLLGRAEDPDSWAEQQASGPSRGFDVHGMLFGSWVQ